ncbi:MAG: CAAX prenyl protease-related protein [Gemmatimonadales bacterium]|nr:MAG: CAAX prenyl protease-related protein [Gemmatimonadales bacterium]
MLKWVTQSASVRYVLPFAAFLLSVAVMPCLEVSPRTGEIIRLVVVGGAVLLVARPLLDFRIRSWAGTVAMGVAVFVVWIAPDLLVAGYRDSPLFRNAVVGYGGSVVPEAVRTDLVFLTLRSVRAVVLVPIVEELFWRAWLPRWIIRRDFTAVPLGTYTTVAFIVTAVLFASEHGAHWDVGLAAGILYNWWMIKTRSLGDCILAHAVTNACLAGYVIAGGQWQYW